MIISIHITSKECNTSYQDTHITPTMYDVVNSCKHNYTFCILSIDYFLSPFLFASCTNASTFSKWCDRRRGRERSAHQHPSVTRGAKPGVEVGNRNTYKLTNKDLQLIITV
jgi:hypothetical protein